MSSTQLQVPGSPAAPSQPGRATRTRGSHGARDGAHFGGRRRRRMLRATPVAVALVAGVTAVGLVVSHHPGGSGHPAGAPITSDLHTAAAVRPSAGEAGPAAAVTTTVAPATTTTVAASTPVAPQPAVTPPPVAPDGSSLPVLIVFNGGTVTLDGAVPNDVARQGLAALATATSKTPNPKVVDRLTIDPRVPTSVGVRVIEMLAARFRSGQRGGEPGAGPRLHPRRRPHEGEAQPDRPGDRPRRPAGKCRLQPAAVPGEGGGRGGLPGRPGHQPRPALARGAGSLDLLTQQSNAAGLALNRRTEFVFYGLMVGS